MPIRRWFYLSAWRLLMTRCPAGAGSSTATMLTKNNDTPTQVSEVDNTCRVRTSKLLLRELQSSRDLTVFVLVGPVKLKNRRRPKSKPTAAKMQTSDRKSISFFNIATNHANRLKWEYDFLNEINLISLIICLSNVSFAFKLHHLRMESCLPFRNYTLLWKTVLKSLIMIQRTE